MALVLIVYLGSDAVWQGGTGVPPVNHAQDARATLKLHHYGLSRAPGGACGQAIRIPRRESRLRQGLLALPNRLSS